MSVGPITLPRIILFRTVIFNSQERALLFTLEFGM